MNRFYITMVILVFLFLNSIVLFSQDQIGLKLSKNEAFPNDLIEIYPIEGTFRYSTLSTCKITWDNNQDIKPIVANKDTISFKIPYNATTGNHTIRIDLPEDWGEVDILIKHNVIIPDDTSSNGTDPDPDTQNGDPIDVGKDPKGRTRTITTHIPPGGNNNIPQVPCSELHVIDGKFTDSVADGRREWIGVTPQQGRFSRLYLDYCNGVLYVLNDWFLASTEPDENSCYNLFVFYTGGGAEYWEVRVYHSLEKGTKVYRNGIDVTGDTTYILAGAYSFSNSLLEEDVSNTIYEFALKVKEGGFFFPTLHDPVRPVGPKVVCNDDGYGLIQEPIMYGGELGNYGTKVSSYNRYIPISGVAGLVKEPNIFAGKLMNDSLSIRVVGKTPNINLCGSPHIIDGKFTKREDGTIEWENSEPAIGKYSNLYADYCDGILYIMNDWILGTKEPDEQNCYNLFELFTGGGKEHWGIFVYHDINKGIKVFRNNVDVTNDTNIVLGGKFSFDTSPLLEEEHTLYEFGIKAEEGQWQLFLCDPGPSSFCDAKDQRIPRKLDDKVVGKGTNSDITGKIYADYNDEITIEFKPEGDMSEWFSRKFKATLYYDQYLFFPIIPSSDLVKERYSFLENINYTIQDSGVIIIEGIANANFVDINTLFYLDGIVLAGYDSVSKITGFVELGNNSEYIKRVDIDTITIHAKSKCPYTNNLVKFKGQILSVYLAPNPVNMNSLLNVEIIAKEITKVQINLYDFRGNLVASKSNIITSLNKGSNKVVMSTQGLISGFYLIEVVNKDHNIFVPVVIAE